MSGALVNTVTTLQHTAKTFHIMRIALYTQGTPFHGRTLEERPLGGSESAVLYVSRTLGRRGHEVTVFNNCPEPGTYDDVTYRPHTDIVAASYMQAYDVCIFSRFYDTAPAVNAHAKVLWLHDIAGAQYYSAIPNLHNIIDRYFLIGKWQQQGFKQSYAIPDHKMYLTHNGVDLSLFERTVPRKSNKLVYINTPFRGLDVLLEVFPAIREQRPDAELFLFTGMSLYGESFTEWDQQLGHLYELAERLPGVHLQLPVTKADLAAELLSARLALYPSHFGECCSIASLETQAAGTPMITSDLAGLKDTIVDGETGVLLDIDDPQLLSRSPDYKRRFVTEALALLQDDRRWEALSKGGQLHIQTRYTWEAVAAEWEAEFLRILDESRSGAEP